MADEIKPDSKKSHTDNFQPDQKVNHDSAETSKASLESIILTKRDEYVSVSNSSDIPTESAVIPIKDPGSANTAKTADTDAGISLESSDDSDSESAPSPPKPAAWAVKEPIEPWCPESLAGLEEKLGIKDGYKNEASYFSDFGVNWLIAAATKRGRMHAHHGTHREDALWPALDSKFSFSCVCDGAGSSKLSRIGSEFAVRTLCKLVKEELVKHQADLLKCSKESLPINLRAILNLCLDTVARELVGLAAKAEMEPKDFRCTVLTVLHYRHPTGGIFLFGNVGDGFLAVKRKGREAERIGTSDSGAFSGEVTCFMPDPQVTEFYKTSLDHNPIISDEDVEAYMLCTDGIEDPFFPIHRTVGEIFTQLFEGYQNPIKDVRYPEGAEPSSIIRAASPGAELLKWLSFEKRGENDDRTITLVYRKSLAELPKEDTKAMEIQPEDQVAPSNVQRDSSSISLFTNLKSYPMLWGMIIGGLIFGCAFLLGLIFGFRLGRAHNFLLLPIGMYFMDPTLFGKLI